MQPTQTLAAARRRTVLIASTAALALCGLTGLAQAQAWPAKTIKLVANGSAIMEKGPEEFTAFHTAEINRWVPVIKASGATLD
jgi:tripartite-type tricarboxylate transporter receptor subunit TctC